MPRSKKSGRAAKAARFRAANTATMNPRNEAFAASVLHKIVGAHDFSMRDEARNTAHNHSAWGQDAKLRARPVAFISAGLIEPLKDLSLDRSNEDHDRVQSQDHDDQYRPVSKLISQRLEVPLGEQDGEAPEAIPTIVPSVAAHPPHETFFIDKTGDKALSRSNHQKASAPRPVSPGDNTDSSAEVILFKGRNASRLTGNSELAHDDINIQIQAVTQRIESTSLTRTLTEHHDTGLEALLVESQADQSDDDAIIADYIANMAKDDGSEDNVPNDPFFTARDLGALDSEVYVDDGSDDIRSLENLAQQGDHSSNLPSSSESDIGDEEDEDGEDDEEDDEEDHTEESASPADQVDDQELARIIAKQEELGIGGDDVLLFSADYITGSTTSEGRSRRKKGSSLIERAQSKKMGRSVPTASALADAFDEFDLMDWGRSNPQLNRKGKRGEVTFDVSDSELDAALQEAWQKDRASKKEKKRAREQLRSQGLLGSKIDPDDPRIKYQDGMSIENIKSELKAFLLSSDTTLALPPMDASARKIIHEIANKFKIKSKSAGSGDQRRPALYRTKNTMKFTESQFEQTFARVGRRYFPRLDGTSRTSTSRKTGGSGRVNHAAVTYRDGEVVGASAPELGESNRGRTMLERMGWSTGMGLGAMDNKGILQPVVHVVKRSKAGLG